MDVPTAVLNRLHDGRWVSTEVQARHPEHRAWIEIIPVINPDKGWLQFREWGLEPLLHRYEVTDDPVEAFTVRYREIHERVEECPFDWDIVGLTIDESYTVTSDQELAVLLDRWLPDLSELGRYYLDPTPW